MGTKNSMLDMGLKMREIKFRGLSVNGHWYYGFLSIVTDKKVCHALGSYISNKVGSPFAYQVRPESVGQYVYTTKKGVDIYVGDKFEVDIEEGLVGFMVYDIKEICFAIAIHEVQNDSSLQFVQNDTCFQWEDMEPIGNIHENPELLEKHDAGVS